MAELAAALGALQPVVYGIVALATLRRWWRHRQPAAAWAAAMFVLLATVLTVSRLLPDPDDTETAARRAIIGGLVLFPYLLLRFAAAFEALPRWLEAVAALATAVVVAGALVVPEIPAEGEDPTPSFVAFVALVVLHWTTISAWVTAWLWRSGHGRPAVVRLRIRTLAAGIALLAAALLLAGVGTGAESSALEVATSALAVAAAPLFLAGLAPPAALLAVWRRPDEAELRAAEAALVAATSPAQVADALLPYVSRAMGGRGAVLVHHERGVVARHGLDDPTAGALDAAPVAAPHHRDLGRVDTADTIATIELRSGRLSVVGDRFAPFFGRDETEALVRLGSLTDVAMQRAELAEAEQEAAAEVARSHQAMREFLSVASHDLRTPIAVVRGYASTMTASWHTLSDTDKREYVAIINRQAAHLARLVADLLTASQLDAGALRPDPEAVDLVAVVEEIVDDLDRADEVAVVGAAGALAWVDEEHAGRIVRNLVENALAYGSAPVEVRIAEVDGRVELRVRDHGRGVDPAFVPHLFDRFARADGAASRAKHGTGLGLAIVRGLARSGGGDAWYEAAAPGACFVVHLPRHDEEREIP